MTDRTLNMPEVEGGDLAAATLAVASLAQRAVASMQLHEGVSEIANALPVPVYRGRR